MAGATRLARHVAKYRVNNPHEKIYLLGHSAGAHVVLAAAEKLAPCSVERIAVTAAMVSFNYDLRPALRSSRDGIDVWYSAEDGLAADAREYFGTADGKFVKTAAEVGFFLPRPNCADAHLYKALRQYPWQIAYALCGHDGRHFGYSTLTFLDAHVIPTMLTPRKQ